ncbi:MAG: hypothetical protein AAFW70_21565 [Cyanobacteria bacterium J06635_10]
MKSDVRSSAVYALGKFGQAVAKYIPDIVNILKDEKVVIATIGSNRRIATIPGRFSSNQAYSF